MIINSWITRILDLDRERERSLQIFPLHLCCPFYPLNESGVCKEQRTIENTAWNRSIGLCIWVILQKKLTAMFSGCMLLLFNYTINHFFWLNDNGAIRQAKFIETFDSRLITRSEWRLAQGARWFVRSWEPLIETGWMELVLASKARKAVVGSVDDTVTDRTLLDTFKFFVKVVLPNSDSFC